MLGVSGTIAEPGQPALAATEGRRTDIDGLRIVVCGSVILLHSLLIFADEPRYHLKSDVTSQFASVAFRFVHIFSMPTFFVLAGWSAVASLRVREPIQFVRERVLRLIVPLVSGMVLFSSAIKYIELSNGRDLRLDGFRLITPLQQRFIEFYSHYPIGRTWSHLWFLLYLFLITILLLPLLTQLARRAPRTDQPTGALGATITPRSQPPVRAAFPQFRAPPARPRTREGPTRAGVAGNDQSPDRHGHVGRNRYAGRPLP